MGGVEGRVAHDEVGACQAESVKRDQWGVCGWRLIEPDARVEVIEGDIPGGGGMGSAVEFGDREAVERPRGGVEEGVDGRGAGATIED